MEVKEIWMDVVGWEGRYIVSNLGRVILLERKGIKKDGTPFHVKRKIKKQTLGKWGYYCVALSKHKQMKTCYVHKLVAEAFIPNPENKPQVNHKDLDKTNNHLSNLEWVTHSENILHYYSHPHIKGSNAHKYGKYSHNTRAVIQYSLDGEKLNEFDTISTAHRRTNASIECICRCCRGKIKTAGGFKWEYKNEK